MLQLLAVYQPPGELGTRKELTNTELYLSFGVLFFTLVLVGLITLVTLKKAQGWGPTTTKLFIIAIVVGSALFLLTAGYSEGQMTPIIGLLGTIVGYALGRSKDERG